MHGKDRIHYLDGHRGLAILLVIFFHAYVRWVDLLPFGNSFAEFQPFKYGWMGVQLFFLISGFVILMTLERCTNIKSFFYRRWIRLFPAMLICCIFIYLTASFFWERPAGKPAVESLLPALTLIDTTWWSAFLHHEIKPLEGAFWSIYVEFKFYAFAAIVYYWRGRAFLFGALIAAFLLTVVSKIGVKIIDHELINFLYNVTKTLSFEHFGWFTSGAAFYVFTQKKDSKWFIFALGMAIICSALLRGFQIEVFIAASLISIIFAASIISPLIQRILNIKILQFFGFISYPLYLIHENIMISTIIKISPFINPNFYWVAPLLAIAFIATMAYLITKFAEPKVKNLIGSSQKLFLTSSRAQS